MNQIVYYREILTALLLICSVAESKLIKPSMNGESKEILIINQKRRVYYPVKSNGIKYEIKGPLRLEFISRYPVPKAKKNMSIPYNYFIILNSKDTIKVNHRYKIQKSIKSIQHPKHNYTYSGNYFINLKLGSHTVEVLTKEQKYPVLIRLITKEFETNTKNKTIVKPSASKKSINLTSDEKILEYFELNSSIPIQIKVMKGKTLKITNRLVFSDNMGPEESYRIRIKNDKKVLGTFFFNTERSSRSVIKEYPNKVPGKWRSCEIPPSKKDNIYTIEGLDREKLILARFMIY